MESLSNYLIFFTYKLLSMSFAQLILLGWGVFATLKIELNALGVKNFQQIVIFSDKNG